MELTHCKKSFKLQILNNVGQSMVEIQLLVVGNDRQMICDHVHIFLFQMSICTMCVQYPQSPKEGIVSARTGLIGNCELPDVGTGN